MAIDEFGREIPAGSSGPPDQGRGGVGPHGSQQGGGLPPPSSSASSSRLLRDPNSSYRYPSHHGDPTSSLRYGDLGRDGVDGIRRSRSVSRSPPPGGGARRGGGADRSPSPGRYRSREYHSHGRIRRSRSRSLEDYDRGGRGGGGASSSPPPAKRRRGGSRSRSRSRSPSPYSRRHRDGGGGGPRGGGGERDRGGGRRRTRSRSYSPPGSSGRRDRVGVGDRGAGMQGGGGGRESARRRRGHPVWRYVDEPMLCGYLWKREMELEEEDKRRREEDDREETRDGDGEESVKKEEEDKEAVVKNEEAEGDDAAAPMEKVEDNEQVDGNNDGATTKKDTATGDDENTYDAYRSKYCLNYIRSFFNAHMDDVWFSSRYSPLGKKRYTLDERDRAAAEAGSLRAEISASLDDWRKSGGGGGGGINKGGGTSDVCSFVAESRLGVGTKPTNAPGGGPSSSVPHLRKRKYTSSESAPEIDVTERDDGQPLPKSHLHSFVKTDSTVRVRDVPPHVTDEQLALSLADHCPGVNPALHVRVYSATVGGGVGSDKFCNSLYRDAWAVFDTKERKDGLLDNLNRANWEANRHRGSGARDGDGTGEGGGGGGNRPKDMPKTLELDVDCSDPFGRIEIDADGKGGAPEPSDSDDEDILPGGGGGAGGGGGGGKGGGGAATSNPASSGGVPKVPVRRATVFVSTVPPVTTQPVTVLSAAVSSAERIGRDKDAAITIARALDVTRAVPRGARLDDLLELLFRVNPNDNDVGDDDSGSGSKNEDVLDVAVAYLRRVHLFSFYNGCTSANCVGDLLAGQHSSGTIHLRLRGADDMLKKAREENDDIYGDLDDGAAPTTGGDDNNMEEGGGDSNETTRDNDGGDGAESTTKSDGDKATPTPKPSLDLLVMRLDESISRALDESTSRISTAGTVVVSDQIDAVAAEIEKLEEAAKDEWVTSHAILDADGRARCSFHFCRKLFKDKVFLRKHLLKKHPEFLRAEVAKCHDPYMMSSWDTESVRPVPQILVDCGTTFGLVPSTVGGDAERPLAEDPEPELWRKEEERLRRLEEEERMYRERQAEKEARAIESERRARERDEMGGGGEDGGPDGGGGGSGGGGGYASNFVDVDDMKDEKVELSFENVDVPAPPPKKKKKKKKKLL